MIYIDNSKNKPMYEQIYEQIKNDIILGIFKPGDKLISTRALAKNLCVSRNTVESAYSQLYLEGYVISKPGSGYIVQEIDNEILCQSQIQHKMELCDKDLLYINDKEEESIKYDFQYANLDYESFPVSTWKKIANEIMSSYLIKDINNYVFSKGDLGLRKEIIKYLRKSRGVYCSLDQIVLCSGTQTAIEIICQLIDEKTLSIEDPGYDLVRRIFENNGFKINPIPVNNDGIDIEYLKKSNSKLVFTTPSHQFPTGAIMPIKNRLEILKWANEQDAFIIEDDYDSEFKYNLKPVPSMQSIDINGRVIYMGTFSKILSPGLRISYIVLPEKSVAKYNNVFNGYYSTLSLMSQKILEIYMRDGYFERHIRKVFTLNKKKHDKIVEMVKKFMGNKVNILGNDGGLYILIEFLDLRQENDLIEQAKKASIKVYPVSKYWFDKSKYKGNMVLLGFSAISEEDIENGIEILSKVWF